MKNKISHRLIAGWLFILSTLFVACTKENQPDSEQLFRNKKEASSPRSQELQGKSRHYYHNGERISLRTASERQYVVYKDVENRLSSPRKGLQGIVPAEEIPNAISSRSAETSTRWAILENANVALVPESSIIYKTDVLTLEETGEMVGLSHLIYLKLKTPNSLTNLREIASKYGLTIVRQNAFMPLWYTLSCLYSRGRGDALDYANLLYETGLFDSVQPDVFPLKSMILTAPNDPLYPQQWGLKNNGQHNGVIGIDIRYEDAHDLAQGTKETIVAVIDEGVDLNHPDINLYPKSYDATTNSSPSKLYGYHGTACAGIIGAIEDNSIGVAGIASKCPIMSISISFSAWYGIAESIANAFGYAVDNKASVISNSWGGGSRSEIIDDAIESALKVGRDGLGCVVVFAAGNENSPQISYPANSFDDVLAVGAMSPCGERKSLYSCDGEEWGSNYGEGLDVVAPGVLIPTTDIHGEEGRSPGDYNLTFNGTSAACPHVSGTAALIISSHPYLKGSEVARIICKSAEKLNRYRFTQRKSHGAWNKEVGYGALNAHRSLVLASNESQKNDVLYAYEDLNGSKTVGGKRILSHHITIKSSGNLTFAPDEILSIEAPFTIEYGGRLTIIY